MTDTLSQAERSRRMSLIRGKDTVPEMVLRRELHALGLRFRLHRKGLPGKPDLIFPKFNAIVLVHGCFWHRHLGCKIATTPKSNTAFWIEKFDKNVARDGKVAIALASLGWRVFVVWECELSQARAKATAVELADRIRRGA